MMGRELRAVLIIALASTMAAALPAQADLVSGDLMPTFAELKSEIDQVKQHMRAQEKLNAKLTAESEGLKQSVLKLTAESEHLKRRVATMLAENDVKDAKIAKSQDLKERVEAQEANIAWLRAQIPASSGFVETSRVKSMFSAATDNCPSDCDSKIDRAKADIAANFNGLAALKMRADQTDAWLLGNVSAINSKIDGVGKRVANNRAAIQQNAVSIVRNAGSIRHIQATPLGSCNCYVAPYTDGVTCPNGVDKCTKFHCNPGDFLEAVWSYEEGEHWHGTDRVSCCRPCLQ